MPTDLWTFVTWNDSGREEFWIMNDKNYELWIMIPEPIQIENWKLKVTDYYLLSSYLQFKCFGVTFYEGFGVVYY